MDERDERKQTSDEASKDDNGIKTGVSSLLQEEHGENLLIGHVVSGV
jgi:hypothetical protein